jgi:putative PIN family toxin of toxin-antitoxin system
VRVVLDTNILVSGLMSAHSPPAQILNAIRAGRVVAVMSAATLAELEDVLQRPAVRRYFIHATLTPTEFLADLRLHADVVSPVPSTAPLRDERDRPFLDLMATTPPPHYFVTGDKDFAAPHYSGVPVISATKFAALLKQS